MRLSHLLAAAVTAGMIAAGHVSVVHADDTEIFLPPSAAAAMQPNILFIMDTSGSMDTKVTIRKKYDPSKTYPGSCDVNRVYWRTASDRRPRCDDTKNFISSSKLLCKSAIGTLDTKGTILIGPLAQFDGSSTNVNKRKWTALTESKDRIIECQADMDLKHGLADGDGLVPTDADADGYSSPPPDNQIAWTDPRDKSYTLYRGNYLNWRESADEVEEKTRMQIVQETAIDTIEGLNNVNVALMRFSDNNEGGMVTHQMSPIGTARTNVIKQIEDMKANGGTPLSETFFEAYRYLTGGAVKFGDSSSPIESVSASRTSMDGGNYVKPSFKACQQNIVVYLTDGDPTVDGSSHADIKNIIGHDCTDNGAVGDEGGGASAGDGKCLDDLAGFMATHDFYDDPALASTGANPEPVENVRTYTIGFGNGVSARGLALLKKTAELGEGEFFEATDPESLKEALDNIIGDLQDQSVSFTSPTVSVNAFNRTQTLNDLFITVFQPETKVHWPGNLKKYRLLPNGTIMDASSPSIAAVDPATGFFAEDTKSYWSATPDQYFVPRGGAANQLKTPDTRKVFTDAGALAGKSKTLDVAENRVVDGNGDITSTMLGLPATATAAERTALINWLRGADVDDDDGDGVTVGETRFEMGDPLHSRPVSVIYGGSASAPEAVVYVATNDGYLHAIDPQDGSELWAFIPSELMPRAKQLREDPTTNAKTYGLDGNLTVHKIDVDGDGTVETGDKVLLYFGMGRGGSNYYALDVTDKNAPKILWRNGATGTLVGLGQTWSTPVITSVRIKNASNVVETKLVMIVGAGYDSTQDNTTAAPNNYPLYKADLIGNRIYIVDANTGAPLWHAGPSTDSTADLKLANMVNSIPADVRVIDLTADGIADRMYVGDMGGRVWRLDIHNGELASALVKGGLFASLGNPSTTATTPDHARRFYSAPDVAAVNNTAGPAFLSIAIGSGYRGHPLNNRIQDRFYGLRDYIPFRFMTDTEITTMNGDPIVDDDATTGADLVNVTSDPAATIPAGSKGWKINLAAGEKVLAEARTFAGNVLFPTFKPSSSSTTNTCKVQSGTNSLYAVNVLNAAPAIDRNGNATAETSDRASNLAQSGIAPAVVILFPTPDTNCTGANCSPPPKCLVGVEECGISFSNAPIKTFWNQTNAD